VSQKNLQYFPKKNLSWAVDSYTDDDKIPSYRTLSCTIMFTKFCHRTLPELV